LFIYLVRCHDLLVDLPGIRAEQAWSDPELGNDVDKCADTAFSLQELIQDDHFSLFQYAITALKSTSFIAYDIFGFIQHFFYLIERSLCIFHGQDITENRLVPCEGTE